MYAEEIGDFAGGVPFVLPAEAGVALRSAGSGQLGDDTTSHVGGFGGVAFSYPVQTSFVTLPGVKAGGAGMGTVLSYGGTGGGSIVILARQDILIGAQGSITANGVGIHDNGGGGGAGGIVVLASRTSVANN